MIRDSARAFVPAGSGLRRIRGLRFTDKGFDRNVYQQMAEMGWLMLRLPEAAGGLGLGMDAYCALARVLGSGLVPEPLIHGALAVRLMGEAADEAVLSGRRIVLPAWQEDWDGLDWAATIKLIAGKASGRKRFVPGAGGADAFLVTAADKAGLVEAGAQGLRIDNEGTQDGGHFGDLVIEAAPAAILPLDDPAAAFDEAVLASGAYLLGLCETALSMTLDYLRVRHQFGKPIGSFQALQHRAADVKIQVELLAASIAMAAAALDAGVPAPRRAALVSQVKTRASDTAMLVAREGVQMHGAIGFTDEHDIGLYVRKAIVWANQFGSANFHRKRFAATQPFVQAA
ncbi:acyl-CoA dehydrogenase family protein [Neorhizobium tomejilense]|uniref:acyl-CoA dehydrogenase family protein n=1 Tax=Neorhizobium tomejilense TaxID=2093828 RepID=UPI003ECF0D0D